LVASERAVHDWSYPIHPDVEPSMYWAKSLYRTGMRALATDALPESTKVTVLRELDKNATYNCQLKQETRNRLLECKRRTLESIRLRYRKIDRANDDKSLFTIGFKVSGEGFKIKLSSVERAGADGIVDLCTVFMTPDLANLSPTEAYETCVPAAVLFCQ